MTRFPPRSSLLLFSALVLGGLFGAGCSSTEILKETKVNPDGTPHRSEINDLAKKYPTEVGLRTGEDIKLRKLRVGPDSASGWKVDREPSGEIASQKRNFSTNKIAWVNIESKTKGRTYRFKTPQKDVSATGEPYRTEINREAEKYPVRVTYRNGTQTKLTDFQISHDEISGVSPSGTSVSVATTRVKTLSILFGEGKWTYHFDKPKQPTQSTRTVAAKTDTSDEPRYTTAIDTEIPKTSMDRPNDVAVVIGVKEYEHTDIPDVDYAVRDAEIMKRYLTRTLGFHKDNVIFVENADGSTLERIFGTKSTPQGQLHNWVKDGKSDVFVYYSGHGAPNPESEKAYLVASDTDPSYLTLNGYSVDQLYANLAKLPAKSVTVVLESCFSGVSEAGQVVQEVSPAVLNVENPMVGMENGLAITAGAADQVSSWYSEKKHGLFTYFFLKGLRGAADEDGDKAVTAGELDAYLTEQVPYQAARQHNRKQTPQVVGPDKDRVLVRYEGSVPADAE